MTKASEAPKFNVIVMLILGVIIGMLAYFLIFYSRANVLGGPDLYPGWTSYGNGNVYGVLAQTEVTVENQDVVSKAVWYVKEGSGINFHSYVKNIGSGRASSGAKVRFCLNAAEACLQTTTYEATAQVGRIGGDVTVYSSNGQGLAAGSRVFKSSSSVVPRVGKHIYTACVINTGEQPDVLANNCTSYGFEVVAQIPGLAYLSCAHGTRCDGYGTSSFTEPDLINGAGITSLPGWFIGEAYAANSCGDGFDNDNDAKIDHSSLSNPVGSDPGCTSVNDNKEENPNQPLCPGNSQQNCEV